MKRYRIYEFGGLDALRLEDAPEPTAGPGQLLLRQEAIGINYSDVQSRIGGSIYATWKDFLPATPGVEGAGEVLAVGEGVDGFAPGDRAAYAGVFGAYAEVVAVPAANAVKLPKGVDSRLAAAVLTQGGTAHVLAHSVVPSMQTVLVHAGAGGVSHLLIQMLKWQGIRVITTVSSEEKAAIAKDAGADHVINYTKEDFDKGVKEFTNGAGVDAVFDGVGKTTFEKGLDCLRPRGYMVLFGESSGAPPLFPPSSLGTKGSLFLTRILSNAYNATPADRNKRYDDLFEWVLSGKLKVRIHATYPFEKAAEAQQELESRRSAGKILLVP